jgi:SAM-dependent methyltransferase
MATIEEINALEQKLAEMKRSVAIPPAVPALLKLDLGCGTQKLRQHNQTTKEIVMVTVETPTGPVTVPSGGFTGVDIRPLPGVDVVCDLLQPEWPWPTSSVDFVNCSHMFEHIPRQQRIHFCNELWRVLKPGAKAEISTPYWCNHRAFGDMAHEWPPVSEYFWLYLNKKWRQENDIEEVGYLCDFDGGVSGYSPAPWLNGRTVEYMTNAFQTQKGAAEDMKSVLIARK